MPVPILATKLYVPTPRPNLVPRPRLLERLHAGLGAGHKLTLVSAAAGFGKTTLISTWAAACGRPIAWLSLDEGDSDPVRFLAYLTAALQTLKAGIGAGLLAALQVHPPPPIESLLTSLLNDVATLPGPFLLILDDYHVIASPAVDDAVAFLIEHQPPQMHLGVATREDPSLPLARLRVRNQLTELRAADLRFTPAEAAEFLNQAMGLSLSAAAIAALEAHTEGWIAGLQMAAISMRGREDTAGFVQAFTGSHRFVLDYLLEEVLARQPERVRNFLLQTAILDRLCVPLCNAVTEGEAAQALLEALDRNNLFLVPLDDQREWYRYHRLFADVLQAHLQAAQPGLRRVLHRRASEWFEHNGLTADAIRHALAAQDLERAAGLIERVWQAMDLSYQSAAWLSWAQALPADLIRARPVLSAGVGWALLGVGELEASEARLRDAERWLTPEAQASDGPAAAMVVVDEAEFRSLPASIAAARADRALALGDIPSTKAYARQAQALDPEGASIHHIQGVSLLGIAEYASGDLPAAERELLKFQTLMWRANDLANAIGITFVLADIKLVQGRLQEAVTAYQQSLHQAASRGVRSFLGASDLYRGLGEVLCEQGDLTAAAQQLQVAQQLGEQSALLGWPHRLCVSQAGLREAQGDLDGALGLLDEAARGYVRNPLPGRPIPALKARTLVRQGRVAEALTWAREQNLSPVDDLSYLREFDHLTLARVLIAHAAVEPAGGHLSAALGLLARLLSAAEAGGRTGSVIEILILQALAHLAQPDQRRAQGALERALRLAEPEGYVRVFVNEGQPMRGLLEAVARRRGHPLAGYAGRLRAAYQPAAAPPNADLAEPLSKREVEVLKLLRSDLSGPEIAHHLSVSLHTLRTHTHHIFQKLGVNNRRAAVRRAEALGLL